MDKVKHELSKLERSQGKKDVLGGYVETFKKHENVTEVSRELLVELVDKVLVQNREGDTRTTYRRKDIKVVFDFRDEFELLQQFNESNHDVAI